MAQPPTGSSVKVNFKNIVLATLAVLGISFVIYFVYDQLGEYYAWSLVFLILLNIYLIYRVTVREKLSNKLFNQEDFVNPSTRPGQKIETDSQDTEEKSGSQIFQKYDQEYPKCQNCEARIIPGLGYCESCGEKLPND